MGPILTASGSASPENLGKSLALRASEQGYALAEGLDLTRDDFAAIVTAIGDLSSHRFGTGTAGLLDLDASPQPDRIVTGQSPLPLHTDGTLVNASPKYIVLYCHRIDQPPGSGCTEMCKQTDALDNAPPAIRALLGVEWEYYVTDTSHFPDIANRWISIPATTKTSENGTRLNIAMPFTERMHSGWQVRLPGKTVEASTPSFMALNEYLRSLDSFYTHQWRQGDILVLDNQQVLHGRTAIAPGGRRHLYRGQVNV